MPAINSRCRQRHKPGFLLQNLSGPVSRQALKPCPFLFFMASESLKLHNHPSLISLISENQPLPDYSLLSFRDCSRMKGQPTLLHGCFYSLSYYFKSHNNFPVIFVLFFVKIDEMYYTVIREATGDCGHCPQEEPAGRLAMHWEAGKERRYEMQKNTNGSGSSKV